MLESANSYFSKPCDSDASGTEKADFFDLPPELHLMVFSHLRPVFSTRLGLTRKNIYPIY